MSLDFAMRMLLYEEDIEDEGKNGRETPAFFIIQETRAEIKGSGEKTVKGEE